MYLAIPELYMFAAITNVALFYPFILYTLVETMMEVVSLELRILITVSGASYEGAHGFQGYTISNVLSVTKVFHLSNR